MKNVPIFILLFMHSVRITGREINALLPDSPLERFSGGSCASERNLERHRWDGCIAGEYREFGAPRVWAKPISCDIPVGE